MLYRLWSVCFQPKRNYYVNIIEFTVFVLQVYSIGLKWKKKGLCYVISALFRKLRFVDKSGWGTFLLL